MAIYHQFTGNHSHALEVSEVPSGTWLPRVEFSACKNEKKPDCVFAPSNQRSMYTTTKLSNRLSCNGSSLTDIHVHVVKTSNTSMVLIGSQFVVPIHTCPCITHSTPHPLSPHLTPSPLIPSLHHSLIPSLPHPLIPSLPHPLTPSSPHPLTPSLPHSLFPSLPHSLTLTFTSSLQLMLSLQSEPSFKSFLDHIQARPSSQGMFLEELLVTPLKRVGSACGWCEG